MDKLISFNVTKVSELLKRKFKALCVERGKTLTEEIQRLMKEELDKSHRSK